MVGPFVARVQTKNESAPEVADLMLQQLNRLRNSPAAADELVARQAGLTGAYDRTVETTEGLAKTLGAYAALDIPASEIGRYDRSVRDVTSAAAEGFAHTALDPARADLIVVGDAKLFLPALKAQHPDSPSLRPPAAQSRQATGATRKLRRSASAARP
jgi:zinc protease